MWESEDEEEDRYFAEGTGHISDNNGIDSDVEAALYAQLHHEQSDESFKMTCNEEYYPNSSKTDVDQGTKTQQNDNGKKSRKLKDSNIKGKKARYYFNDGLLPNQLRKSTHCQKLVSDDVAVEVSLDENIDSVSRKKRKKKNKVQAEETLSKEKELIDLTWSSPNHHSVYDGQRSKRKRKKHDSKYDYSLERRTCHVSVEEDVVGTPIILSSDTEGENQKQIKFDLNENEVEMIRRINETTGDLYNAYVDYEKEVLTQKKSVREKDNSLFNIKDVCKLKNETFIEIDSSSDDNKHDCQKISLPTDILLNVNHDHMSAYNKNNNDVVNQNKKQNNNNNINQSSNKSKALPVKRKTCSRSKNKTTNKQPEKHVVNKSTNKHQTVEEVMKHFYDSDEGEDYEVEEILRNMKGSWDVVALDLDPAVTTYDKKRYFFRGNISLRCVYCQEIGHTHKMCQKIKTVSRCYLCGNFNHSSRKCRFAICPRCQLPGHKSNACPTAWRDLRSRCQLCKMPGHFIETCPDHWRRYYLTTKPGELVRGTKEKNIRKYCYNCGAEGHLGHVCVKSKMSSSVFPNTPFIVSYDKVVIVENDLALHSQKMLNCKKRKKQRKIKHIQMDRSRRKEKKQLKDNIKKKRAGLNTSSKNIRFKLKGKNGIKFSVKNNLF